MPIILDPRLFPETLTAINKDGEESLSYLRQSTGAPNDRELVELALYTLETISKEEDKGLKIYSVRMHDGAT